MRQLADHLFVIVVALWVGALWAVGYLVTPTLFAMIDDRALAGNVAGRLFALVGWLGIGSAGWVLLFIAIRHGWAGFRTRVFWLVVLMLVLVVAGQFGVQPLLAQLKAEAWPQAVMDSPLRERFATWHGVSSVLYLVLSLLGLVLVAAARRLVR
jgi:hypothetical protein